MSTDAVLERERYRCLVLQLRSEGRSQREVAKLLGVSQAFIGFVEKGERPAGLNAISAAKAKMRLSSRFFEDPALGESPDYREHTQRDAHVETELPPIFKAFYGSPIGADTTDEEKQRLQDRRWREGLELSLEDLVTFRMMIRNAKKRGLPPLTEQEQELERTRIAKGRPRNVLVGRDDDKKSPSAPPPPRPSRPRTKPRPKRS